MGADRPIIVKPRFPAEEDHEILGFLRLAKALASAVSVELELRAASSDRVRTYGSLSGARKPHAWSLAIGDDFAAILRITARTKPAQELIDLLSEYLARIIEARHLRTQASLLSGALDTTSSAILLFDAVGEIIYANPPADRLLSLQTEDELLAECDGHSRQPLFTLLCSLVDTIASTSASGASWKGTLDFADGLVMICEVRWIGGDATEATSAVLVLLRPIETESDARVEALSTSHGLSPREQEVLHLLVQGRTTAAMADELGISPHTVRDHLKHLYRKTNTSSRSELLGLISRPSRVAIDA